MIEHLSSKLCDDDLVNAPKVLRTCVYVQKPTQYDFQCLLCGGENIEWSEFESHIWCYDCNKDVFIPQPYAGIFGGPIPVMVSQLLGVCFDRITLDKHNVLKWDGNQELNYEKSINKDRFSKLKGILSDEISRWEDTWVYDEELENYKVEINKKIYI